MSTNARNKIQVHLGLAKLGFNIGEAEQLRRISMTLTRWAELECGNGNDYASWAIERDEATEIPYMVTHPHTGKSYRNKVADREKGALKRLAAIMATHPELVAYHQGDPRGCALYIIRKADLGSRDVGSCYTIGHAVY